MRSEPRKQAAFRMESSGYTLDGVAPGRKPYCRDQTSCSPSHGCHGPRHSAWDSRLSNDTPLPRTTSWRWSHCPRPPPPPHSLLIARPPSRPKRSSFIVITIQQRWTRGLPKKTHQFLQLLNLPPETFIQIADIDCYNSRCIVSSSFSYVACSSSADAPCRSTSLS